MLRQQRLRPDPTRKAERRCRSRRTNKRAGGETLIDTAIYFLFRRRTLFLLLGPAALLIIARATPSSFWWGVTFVVLGNIVRIWSAGYLSKLSRLITAGPFGLCRNPLYVGSFIICAGYLAMCNRLDAWIAGTILFWLFHGGAVAYEEMLLKGKFGEEYNRYCESVPRFLPRLRRIKGEGDFSMGQLMLNNEYRSVGASLIVTAIFAWRAFTS